MSSSSSSPRRRRLGSSRALRVSLSLSLLAGVIGTMVMISSSACTTDYQKGLDDPLYGTPNALAGQTQPGPSSDDTTADGATQTNPNSASGPVCVGAGGTIIDGGTCAVKFSTDILPALAAGGCQTVGSCHGGATPGQLPAFDNTDPNKQWATFAAFKLSNGVPYINPCSIDPTKSSMGCNVSLAAPCGSVMPPGVGLPADAVTKITTWLTCGSPNN